MIYVEVASIDDEVYYGLEKHPSVDAQWDSIDGYPQMNESSGAWACTLLSLRADASQYIGVPSM